MSLSSSISALATRIGQVVKPLLFIPTAPTVDESYQLKLASTVYTWEIDNRPKYLYLTGTQVNSTTTLASTALSVPVVIGTYYFKAFVVCSVAASTTGTRVVLNGPAFSKLKYGTIRSNGAALQLASGQNAWLLPALAAANSGTLGAETTIEGIVVLTAAGNLVVQFASENTNSVTIEPGSYLSWYKIS